MNVSIFVHSFRYYSLSAVVLIHITVTGLFPLRNNQDIDSTCTENDSIPCEKVVNAQQETSDITMFLHLFTKFFNGISFLLFISASVISFLLHFHVMPDLPKKHQFCSSFIPFVFVYISDF